MQKSRNVVDSLDTTNCKGMFSITSSHRITMLTLMYAHSPSENQILKFISYFRGIFTAKLPRLIYE